MQEKFNRIVIRKVSIIILISTWHCLSYSQTSDEINSMKIYPREESENQYIDSSRINNSEYELIFGSLFRFYKNHISAHDAGNCVFQPSCSEYALSAIKKQGVLIGMINSIDRITQCNKRSRGYFLLKTGEGLILDPVRNVHYEEK